MTDDERVGKMIPNGLRPNNEASLPDRPMPASCAVQAQDSCGAERNCGYPVSMERSDYERIEEAILFIERTRTAGHPWSEVAAHAGLSPYHFQRLFRRWAGVTPKQFLGFVTLEGAKELLRASAPLLDASLELGLSGPSRLHDLFVSIDAVTPGDSGNGGGGNRDSVRLPRDSLRPLPARITPRGICRLEFCPEGGERAGLVRGLRGRLGGSASNRGSGRGAGVLAAIFPGLPPAGDAAGRPTGPEAGCVETTGGQSGSVRVLLRGTNFQVKVWAGVLGIPRGRPSRTGDWPKWPIHPERYARSEARWERTGWP
jgi:AraC family transcriptional regulator of adaptative response/methylated-DNA-[protein]-cysteine methyltransferase